MAKTPRITGIDIPWFDQLVRLPAMPEDNGSTRIEETSCQGGGKVATALVAAARQGISCKIIAAMGDSARSKFLMEDFERHGIDTKAVKTLPGYTEGASIVISDKASGGRRILWSYDNSQQGLTVADIELCRTDIAASDYLHLCRMDEIDRYAAKIAHENGVKVCFDADFYTDEIAASLDLIDVFIGSEEFYSGYFQNSEGIEENLKILSARGPSIVIFTFGKRGCQGYADGNYFQVPAFHKNITVADTVGAGDVFHGGYLAALCMGYSPKDAAVYASAVSAIKCTGIGGRAAIPTANMVHEYLTSGTFTRGDIDERLEYYKHCI